MNARDRGEALIAGLYCIASTLLQGVQESRYYIGAGIVKGTLGNLFPGGDCRELQQQTERICVLHSRSPGLPTEYGKCISQRPLIYFESPPGSGHRSERRKRVTTSLKAFALSLAFVSRSL
jgi:hypothetical protein